MSSTPSIDRINQHTWTTGQVLRQYRNYEGYTDPGERAATERIAAECRDRPILDLGVGCGRTAPLLRLISADYLGVDYTPQLLEVSKQKYPDLRFQCMDARDLSAFGPGSFYLVNFSFNAIDAVDMRDRGQILREVHRVLQPGGIFLFSAHNKNGPGPRESWRTLLPGFSRNPVKLLWRTAKALLELPMALTNHFRYGRLRRDNDDYTISNAAAHHFGLVLLYVSLAEQLRELREAGFEVEAVYESQRGQLVRESDDVSAVWWFHFLARKPRQQ